MVIAHISSLHDRQLFDCGVDDMNRYLREQAKQEADKGMSHTFISLADDGIRIIGYYTLTTGFIDFEHIPQEKRLSRHPAPVVLLARLAVDNAYKGQRIGERLLFDAQARVLEVAETVGIYAMTLDAREDSLCSYYEQFGFKRRADGPLRMYKTMKAIRSLSLVAEPLTRKD